MFKHILIPTDGSTIALKAAKAGIRFAAKNGARVTAFHAIDEWQPVYSGAYAADARAFVDFEKLAREAGETQVAAVRKLAEAARVPFASLVSKARSHGRRGVARLMMGSVTLKVLAHATVPVLAYR